MRTFESPRLGITINTIIIELRVVTLVITIKQIKLYDQQTVILHVSDLIFTIIIIARSL